MAAYNPCLGTFSILPRELRDQVWEYLSMEHHLAFVQASHQVYAEATPIMNRTLYKDVVLKFCISPKYKYKSWLTVESQFMKKRTLQSLDHAIKSGLHRIHYEKLGKIMINIDAPDDDWKDRGQIICLYKKCLDLASLLEHATNGLPDIEINLLQSSPVKWGNSLKLGSRVEDESGVHHVRSNVNFHMSHGSEGEEWDDAELVLHTFCRLRNARSANAYRPATTSGDRPHDEDLVALRIPKPFNTDLDPDDLADQRVLDGLFLGLEDILDVLDGDTASMLRVDRFASWYSEKFENESKYEKELQRIYETWTFHQDKRRRLPKLFKRYSGMVIYGLQQQKDAEFSSVTHTLENTHVQTPDDTVWGQDTWPIGEHAYYKGVPPFDSKEYCQGFDRMAKQVDQVSVQKRRDEFYEGIRTWMLTGKDTTL